MIIIYRRDTSAILVTYIYIFYNNTYYTFIPINTCILLYTSIYVLLPIDFDRKWPIDRSYVVNYFTYVTIIIVFKTIIHVPLY